MCTFIHACVSMCVQYYADWIVLYMLYVCGDYVCLCVCVRERECVCVISHVLIISPIMARKHLFKKHISKDNSSIASNVCHSVEWDSVESFC